MTATEKLGAILKEMLTDVGSKDTEFVHVLWKTKGDSAKFWRCGNVSALLAAYPRIAFTIVVDDMGITRGIPRALWRSEGN